ncbi:MULTISPECIES: hypothetical protein [Tenacibaculum]|uniref:hypothetical protein n=1 Tax=Tenacibaculum TaxID=104267 RepID=UPI001F0A697B|nr:MULTISPECIES: hypothetical protein [Tenacibaculum]MCH3881981.1 hypothetical protein [Tenacibaculum aquimarinum]MDO6600734.1 hypothetical protein [Tenacibaculum sp. 1_MG-2023]
MQSNIIYNNDSENQATQKRSLEELNMWISHINYISEECDYIVKIASNKLKKKELRDNLLLVIKKKNSLKNTFLEYKKISENIIECIDLDCDLFYYKEHVKTRDLYKEYVDNYRSLKKEVFLGLLA